MALPSWTAGDVSGSQVLDGGSGKDHLYAAHINELRAALDATNLKTYNLKRYGAKVDGVTDDTSIINTAIQDIKANGGGRLFIPGFCATTASVITDSNVIIEGIGVGISGLIGADADYTVLMTTKSGTSKTTYSNVGVRNLTIKSRRGYCMRLDNITGVLLDNVENTFLATPLLREAMMIEHCQYARITSPYVHDTAGNGLQINGCDYVTVVNPQVHNTADDGIDIDKDFVDTALVSSRWVSISGGNVDGVTGGNGIRIGSCNRITVTGTVIENISGNGASGVLINSYDADVGDPGLRSVNITGLEISNCLTNGVLVDGANAVGVSLNANNLYLCGQAGGSNIRAGIQLSAAGVACNNNTLDTCGKTGSDGGAIVVFKKNGQSINGNRVINSPTALTFWNGDSLQSYTSMQVKGNYLDSSNTAQAQGLSVTAGDISGNWGINPSSLYAVGNSGAAKTIARVNGDHQTITMTANCTFTFTAGQVKGDLLTLELTQDATGSRTATWPANFKKTGGTLTLSTAIGATDVITTRWDGTNWIEISRALNVS